MRPPRVDDLDLPLADLMLHWPQAAPVFLRHKMLCVGCLIGPFHTIVDACAEYHLDQDTFVAELIAAVSGQA